MANTTRLRKKTDEAGFRRKFEMSCRLHPRETHRALQQLTVYPLLDVEGAALLHMPACVHPAKDDVVGVPVSVVLLHRLEEAMHALRRRGDVGRLRDDHGLPPMLRGCGLFSPPAAAVCLS